MVFLEFEKLEREESLATCIPGHAQVYRESGYVPECLVVTKEKELRRRKQ